MLDTLSLSLILQTPPANPASLPAGNLNIVSLVVQAGTLIAVIGAAWKLAKELGQIQTKVEHNTEKIAKLEDVLTEKIEKVRDDLSGPKEGIGVRTARIEEIVKRLEDDVKEIRTNINKPKK